MGGYTENLVVIGREADVTSCIRDTVSPVTKVTGMQARQSVAFVSWYIPVSPYVLFA